ncbi:MAG: carbohydrate ABC transporter permease [Clostridiales bacterium]|nr:carbohydrate ABC transporter permease [Clostridiales bacterium]
MSQTIRPHRKSYWKRAISGRSTGDLIFLGLDYLLITLLLIIIAYPLLYVVVSSFAGGSLYGNGLSLIPERWTLEGYRAVFEYKYVWTGYRNSLIILVMSTSIAMVVTTLCAYPLSRKDFMGRKFCMTLCMITMYFGGGMIPTYLLIKDLGLLNTWWALVLPGSLSVYNMIVMRTYFSSQIPDEMREAAQIDGCGNWRFLLQIVLPLSGPILAVIALYYSVTRWNAYFSSMLYIRTKELLPLPNILREILILNQSQSLTTSMASEEQADLEKRAELMKYSLIIVSSLPMMVIYPFVQKYFVKGTMIGAVKG